MPPKGWRKNADGSYPQPSKEREKISIDDILFPKATLLRLSRAILPEGNIVSKDSSIVIQRSATVFVSHLLVHARENAKKYDRKTVTPQDIIAGLETAEFSSFIPSVRQELDSYQAHKDHIRERKRQEKLLQPKNVETSNEDEGEEGGTELQKGDPETEQPSIKRLKPFYNNSNGSREATVSEPEADH